MSESFDLAPKSPRPRAQTPRRTSERARRSPPTSAPLPTIIVGDVHGDLDGLVETLQHAGLLDSRRRWCGGRGRLVQLGDCVDRGRHSIEVLDLLRRLQDEAARDGGEVVRLLGNHELELMRDCDAYARNLPSPRRVGARLRDEAAEGRLHAAAEVHGWLCLHGGLQPALGRQLRVEAREAGHGKGTRALVAHANQLLRMASVTRDFSHAYFDRDEGALWTYAHDLVASAGARRIPQIVGHSVNDTPFGRDGILTADQGLSYAMCGVRSYLSLDADSVRWTASRQGGPWLRETRALADLWVHRMTTTSEAHAA